jgi:hypothetical protein
MANYIIRGPKDAVHNGDHPSMDTANADLSAANWTASADAADPTDTLCPRAFVPNYAGTLAFRAVNDSADTIMIVSAGTPYPIAIKQITRASCSAALQVANAVALLY